MKSPDGIAFPRHLALAAVFALTLAACQPRNPDTAPAAAMPAPATAPSPAATPATPAAPATADTTTHWQCGDTRVGAAFDTKAEKVALSLNGRMLSLPLARSASGARYADEAGNEFWTKGDSGTLTLAGEKSDCTRAEGPSPWDAARARGIAFRAVGNEPGWMVEVGRGESPSLQAQLDFGARTLDIARMEPLKDGAGFAGQTANGTKVELRIARERCVDDMSGASFEAAAQLSAGGKTYRGCGAFLAQ
jgi:membrane-bound inhibitor of C-type lysozyme